MSKFCGNCGSPLDEKTGLCPNCDREKLQEMLRKAAKSPTGKFCGNCGAPLNKDGLCPNCDSAKIGSRYQRQSQEMSGQNGVAPQLSRKEAKRRRKEEKKRAKRAKKIAERDTWSFGKKVRRWLLKLLLYLILFALLACGCIGTLLFFNIIDIAAIGNIINPTGVRTTYPSGSDFNDEKVGELYFYQTKDEHIATNASGINYVDNEVLLVATDTTTYEDIDNLAKDYNAEIVGWIEQTGDYQLKLVQIYSEEELNRIVRLLEEDERVVSAYVNYVSVLADEKTESRNGFIYGNKWESDLQNFNDCKGKSWGLEAVETLAAWDILHAQSSHVQPVRIGLVDSGFDVGHEDLMFAETFYNTVSDHGTHVAGTMAANANNREGICGVYPYGDGNLYGVSYSGVCNYSENGTPFVTSMFLKIAYSELILRNVKVINTSLGFNYYMWPLSYTDPEWDNKIEFVESNAYILGDFLNRLIDKGYDFVLVTAAGNDSDRENNIVYDSRYNFWTTVISETDYPDVYNRIIVVGAVDSNFNICNFSNGGDRVDIYAPGDTIYSTLPNNKYENKGWSGTSMASPHVSGIAAMVWSLNNDLNGSQVKEIICRHSNKRCTSCKMVDAYLALESAVHTDTNSTEVKTEYGSILCWVVDANDEDIKIENAIVTATNVSTKETESTTTDKSGHFELVLPEGKYMLSVKADGYMEYIWPDDKIGFSNPIVVKNHSVNYLEDWIKIKKIGSEFQAIQYDEGIISSERNIVLALDVSGSMSGTPIEETRKAATKFIQTILGEDASIGVVTYNYSASILSDFSTSKQYLTNSIDSLYANGGTNIDAGLTAAHDMLSESSARKKIIVLMSDGEPNDGRVGEQLIDYAQELKDEGILIYTLGFFEDLSYKSAAQDLMERIASDGCHYEVDDAENLVFFFGDVADQINGQKYIYVRIACPVDVTVSYRGETLDSSLDNLSTRTSFGSLSFEQSANMEESNSDDRVKVLRLKEGTDYDIHIEGTGRGHMTYTIGFQNEDGTYSDLRRFVNVKISRKTVVDTVAKVSDVTELNVDDDGDGKYDTVYRARANERGRAENRSWILYVAVGALGLGVLLVLVLLIRSRRKQNNNYQ